MKQDMIVILDLGSTENTVLARAIRALGVYSEIYPHDITAAELTALPSPAWIVMDRKDYQALQGSELGNMAPALSGRFDKNDYVLLHLP